MTVRVTNPETGAVVFPYTNRHGTTYTVERTEMTTELGAVIVKIMPSFRPGCEYDLTSYPESWLTDEQVS